MIESLTIERVADAMGAKVRRQADASNTTIHGLAIDSRDVVPGDLFAAIPGARVDGHDYVAMAAERGAAAALVQRPVDVALPQLVISDVEMALADFGRLIRAGYDGVLVGITGSAGKTTAKNMLAEVLSRSGRTIATEGNLNNELGVPLTLARLTDTTEFAVLEMGAGKPDDIAWLRDMAQPTVGVLLNVAPAHLAQFRDIDHIADTKAAILEALPENGLAVFNGDQRWSADWRNRSGAARVITFGLSKGVDYRCVEVTHCGFEGSRLDVATPQGEFEFGIAIPGEAGVYNALATIAVAHALGISMKTIAASLAHVKPAPGRGRVYEFTGGGRLVDDTYNANPLALKSAIDVLAGSADRTCLVMGSMLELGSNSAAMHAEIGHLARQQGIDELWVVGELARPAAEAFGAGARYFVDAATLLEEPAPIQPNSVTLVKASRGAALDQVVTAWCDRDRGNVAC